MRSQDGCSSCSSLNPYTQGCYYQPLLASDLNSSLKKSPIPFPFPPMANIEKYVSEFKWPRKMCAYDMQLHSTWPIQWTLHIFVLETCILRLSFLEGGHGLHHFYVCYRKNNFAFNFSNILPRISDIIKATVSIIKVTPNCFLLITCSTNVIICYVHRVCTMLLGQ